MSVRGAFLLAVICIAGCNPGTPIVDPAAHAQAEKARLENEGKPKAEGGSILGRKTQDIGEFNPEDGREVSDSKINATNPLTYGMEAMGPMMEKVAKLGIDHSLSLFYAEHGYYPKTHEEFMQKIIKAGNIRLPVLPAGAEYQYDVANHKLVVVKAKK